MAIDTSIYGQIQQPKPVNLLAEYANLMQLQGAQQANQLNTLKMDEYQRGVERQNRLSALLQNTPDDQLEPALMRGGFMAEAKDLGTYRSNKAKEAEELQGKKLDRMNKKVGFYRDNVSFINDPGQAAQYVTAIYNDPDLQGSAITAVPLEKLLAQIPQDAAQLGGWKQQFALGATKFMELNKPTIVTRNLGGTTETLATEGLTGATRVVNTAQNTQSPDNKASVGASLANAAAVRETAAATRDAARIKAGQDAEMKLADDYRTESKGFAETSTAMKKVLAAIQTADKNPGSALAAGTGFMKILDPSSVVRETELGMALNASGWFDRATNIANTLQSGRVMTPTQKENLKTAAEALFEEAKAAQREIDAAYQRRAKDYGLNPQRIIVDRGQTARRPVDIGKLPTSGAKVVEFGSLK